MNANTTPNMNEAAQVVSRTTEALKKETGLDMMNGTLIDLLTIRQYINSFPGNYVQASESKNAALIDAFICFRMRSASNPTGKNIVFVSPK